MTDIREEDLIGSISDAPRFISCYHPEDYIANLTAAWRAEDPMIRRSAR